ncbi:MAG: hypothetical protein H7301_14295 [Cryobacterium sp.]|nr:hypothetical protein [Oligoflexia bacterium]
MSAQMILISLIAHLFILSAQAENSACPSDLPVDQLLPGTEIRLKTGLNLPPKSLKRGDQADLDAYFLTFVNGDLTDGASVIVGLQRSVSTAFFRHAAKDRRAFESGRIPPFQCRVVVSQSNAVRYRFGEDGGTDIQLSEGCPMATLSFDRASLDPRTSQMTLASLKHNLGPSFEVIARCAETDGKNASVSSLQQKPEGLSPDQSRSGSLPQAGGLSTQQAK